MNSKASRSGKGDKSTDVGSKKYYDFWELRIWQKAKKITLVVYGLLGGGKIQKDWGMINQIKRSAISISSNIAEGSSRGGKGQFVYFLRVAKGSCGELHSQLLIGVDLGYFDEKEVTKITHELFVLSRMIATLIGKLT